MLHRNNAWQKIVFGVIAMERSNKLGYCSVLATVSIPSGGFDAPSRSVRPVTLSQTSPGFYVSGSFVFACQSLLKTLWEKEKLLVKSNFSFSHIVFYPFGELSTIVMDVWERVKSLSHSLDFKRP